MSETSYTDRTDGVEEKLRLLQDAYSQGNHDLTMSLVESIKDTVVFERQRKKIGADSVSGAETFAAVTELPAAWAQWARGWQFCKVLELSETAGIERRQEPVDICVGFLAEHTADLQREVRVARIDAATGTLCEVISQVYGEVFEEGERCCRVVFFADVPARGQVCYLVFYGNPFAELPRYATDLQVRGEGYGLDIENSYYAARLSRQMGQLERMRYKRTHGLELFIEGDGHGEPPHIDWAHDYLAQFRSGPGAPMHTGATLGFPPRTGASALHTVPDAHRCKVHLLCRPALLRQGRPHGDDPGLRAELPARRRMALCRASIYPDRVDGSGRDSARG